MVDGADDRVDVKTDAAKVSGQARVGGHEDALEADAPRDARRSQVHTHQNDRETGSPAAAAKVVFAQRQTGTGFAPVLAAGIQHCQPGHLAHAAPSMRGGPVSASSGTARQLSVNLTPVVLNLLSAQITAMDVVPDAVNLA